MVLDSEKDYLRSVHVWPPLEGCYKHTDLCIVKNLDTEEDDFDFGNGETDYEIYADQSVSIVIVVRLQMWGLRHLNRKRMYRRIRRELAVGMMSHVRLGVRALQGVHEMVTMVAKYMY